MINSDTVKFIRVLSYVLILLNMTSCVDNSELEKSIFNEDPQDPSLPIYSESGYNTFGVHYDRSTIVSNDFQVPIKVVNHAGVTTFTFTGQRDSYASIFSIQFSVNELDPQSYSDLISMDKVTIDLTSPNCNVTVNDGGNAQEAQILDGSLVFKRASNLKVDNLLAEVVLSGTFEFHAIINQLPVTMSKGRFDVGVDDENFYKY